MVLLEKSFAISLSMISFSTNEKSDSHPQILTLDAIKNNLISGN